MSRILSNLSLQRHASRLVYNEYGPPSEVVKLEQFEDPPVTPKDTKVVVKMLAAPVHPADINTIQGTYPIKPSLPAIGGGEGVGEVLSIGPQVQNLKIGDWVFPGGNMSGTWTTRFVDDEVNFVKVRKDISVLSASTLRTNPGTAYRMLKDFVDLQEGDIVIQNGANSAVGRAVIEIAKVFNLKTVNIVRDRPTIAELKQDLENLGADIVWTEEELRKTSAFREKKMTKPKLALNCVGGQSGTEILKCLSNGGCHVTYGGMSLKPVITPTSALIFKDISVRGFWMSKWIENNFNDPARATMYEELAEMAVDGKLSAPKNSFVHLNEFKTVMSNCMKGFKDSKYIFDLS